MCGCFAEDIVAGVIVSSVGVGVNHLFEQHSVSPWVDGHVPSLGKGKGLTKHHNSSRAIQIYQDGQVYLCAARLSPKSPMAGEQPVGKDAGAPNTPDRAPAFLGDLGVRIGSLGFVTI